MNPISNKNAGKSCWNSYCCSWCPRKFNLRFNKFPHLFCWFKGLDAEDLLGCREHRGPRLSTGATKKGGVRSWVSRWNHERFVLKKRWMFLSSQSSFKFQFAVWMTLPNLRSDNSFWLFQEYWSVSISKISMFKIRFCLWLINFDQTCELWKRAGPGEERGRCWWNFHATELGTKIKVGLTSFVRKNALRNGEDFEISWISSRLAK